MSSNRPYNLPAGQNVGMGAGDAMGAGNQGRHYGGGGGGGDGNRRRGGRGGGGGGGYDQHRYNQALLHAPYGYLPYPYYHQPSGAGYQNGPGYGYSQSGYVSQSQYMQYVRPLQSQQQPHTRYPHQPHQPPPRQFSPSIPPAAPYLASPIVPMAQHSPGSVHSSISHITSPTPWQSQPPPLVVSSDIIQPPQPEMPPPLSEAQPAMRQPAPVHSTVGAPSPTIAVERARSETSEPTRSESSEPPRSSFRPPLPWLSRPDLPFPTRTSRKRRRRPMQAGESAEMPSLTDPTEQISPQTTSNAGTCSPSQTHEAPATPELCTAKRDNQGPSSLASDATTSTAMPTPSSSQDVSLTGSGIIGQVPFRSSLSTATGQSPTSQGSHKVFASSFDGDQMAPDVADGDTATTPSAATTTGENEATTPANKARDTQAASTSSATAVSAPPVKVAPRSWASLLTSTASRAATDGASANTNTPNGQQSANGGSAPGPSDAGVGKGAHALANALRSYRVTAPAKLAFIEPRGLINTGNMCYMNSVLQVLIFCLPFYDFLDQISKKAAHSFKSETPLIDAMVLFLREFKVIDAATSAEQLRRRLKPEEYETFGEPFTPDFVYDIIRRLPRFADMRRGHQQDAEEFLGFLLQSLDDECGHVMGLLRHPPPTAPTTAQKGEPGQDGSSEWQEVGRRQRAAVTRSSGQNSSSPIFKMFGGFLRSELRVSGLKDSITNEPYQPLQLDIGSAKVHNIMDALRHLTTPESISGNFNPERGANISATKQVYIETLPPVLILHLKRFQFDVQGHGTVKLWKKVGYPLDLEIPREVFSRQKRNSLLSDPSSLPRYRLTAVVYHHGKNASTGHYTADVRRQDGQEWIRLDDTSFSRVSSAEVAAAGAEEDSKLAAPRRESPSGQAGGSRINNNSTSNGNINSNNNNNRFGAIHADADGQESAGDDDDHNGGWKQVNASTGGGKKWSSAVNEGATGTGAGAANATVNASTAAQTATKSKQAKESVRDNKVAYILFYQRV